MTVRVREDRFQEAHRLFMARMQHETDVPFTGWDHPELYDKELSYKHTAWRRAHDELKLYKWDRWRASEPRRILDAVRRASEQEASHNLVFAQPHHDAALEPVRNPSTLDTPVLEEVADNLYRWFRDPSDETFSSRFDGLAQTLRQSGLSCHGSWLAYLAFLYDRTSYFPMRPTYFEELLHFYGNPELRVAGRITWERYHFLLDLASKLSERLAPVYGEPNAIEIQSYMWVVAYYRREGWTPPATSQPVDPVDAQKLLQRRVEQACTRERRGLLGELFVLNAERDRLRSAGRSDLAKRVRHVAAEATGAGFDVLTFSIGGEERRIEVKATAAAPEVDQGFFLTENERRTAQDSDDWRVFRVWNVESAPKFEDIGNIVAGRGAEGWKLRTATWRCVPSSSE